MGEKIPISHNYAKPGYLGQKPFLLTNMKAKVFKHFEVCFDIKCFKGHATVTSSYFWYYRFPGGRKDSKEVTGAENRQSVLAGPGFSLLLCSLNAEIPVILLCCPLLPAYSLLTQWCRPIHRNTHS